MSLREDPLELRGDQQLSIDYIACDGWGLCAELLPENIELDDWGFPIIVDDRIGPKDVRKANRALRLCPALAMRLEQMRAKASSRR